MGTQLPLGEGKRVIPFRQLRRKVERFTADGMPFVLHALFGGQQPGKLSASLNCQRHFLTSGINHDIRHRGHRHLSGGGGAMHSVKQTPLGFDANRLRFTVGINVIGADPRRQRGIIQTFAFHRDSLTFRLPDTSLIIADGAIRTEHAATRGIQNRRPGPGFLVTIQHVNLLLGFNVGREVRH